MIFDSFDEMDFDDEGFEPTDDELAETEAEEFGGECLRQLAIKHMALFFQGREYYCGGKIPDSVLFNRDNVNLVVETEMSDGITRIHRVLRHNDLPRNFIPRINHRWEIQYVLSLLNLCERIRIQKEFAAGIILIYLELCEGMNTAPQKIWN